MHARPHTNNTCTVPRNMPVLFALSLSPPILTSKCIQRPNPARRQSHICFWKFPKERTAEPKKEVRYTIPYGSCGTLKKRSPIRITQEPQVASLCLQEAQIVGLREMAEPCSNGSPRLQTGFLSRQDYKGFGFRVWVRYLFFQGLGGFTSFEQTLFSRGFVRLKYGFKRHCS